MEDLNQIMILRREKLNTLADMEVNPYTYIFNQNDLSYRYIRKLLRKLKKKQYQLPDE